MDPLSGSQDSFAPTHPVDPSQAGGVPAMPKLSGGKVPAAPPVDPTPAAAPVDAPEAPPPADDFSGRVPASDEPDAEGNPFAAQPEPPATTPAGDVEGNPFAPPPPGKVDPAKLKSAVETNIAARGVQKENTHLGAGNVISPQDFGHDLVNGLAGGFDASISGLLYNRKTPDQILPEHAPMAMLIGSQIGQFVGDLPVMLPAMTAGGLVGGGEGAVAGSVVPGPGTAIGAIAGGGAGAMVAGGAAPAFVRKGITEYYEKNGFSSDKRSFVASLMAASWEGIKAGGAMLVGGKVGGAVGGKVAEVAAPYASEAVAAVAGNIANKTAELGAMTSVGAGLEGRLPEWREFAAGGIFLTGMHGITAAAGALSKSGPTEHQIATEKLQNTFVATGETPAEITRAMDTDVELRQKLIAGNRMEPEAAAPNRVEHELVHEEPTVEGGERKVIGSRSDVVKDESVIPPGVGTLEEKPLEAQGKKYSPEIEKTLGMIGEHEEAPGKSVLDRVQDWAHSAYANNVDYLDPLTRAMADVAGQGVNIAKEMNPESQARVFAAHTDTVRSVFEMGTIDGKTGEINGEGLNSIMRSIPHDGDAREFTAYMMAKRGLELKGRGFADTEIHSTFNPAEAESVVGQLEQKYEGTWHRLQAFNERMIDYATAKGLYSEETANIIKDQNKSYSPMARAQAFDEFDSHGPGVGGNPMKRIFGSSSDILDPVMQTYLNTQKIVKAAKINEVRSGTVDFLRKANLIEDFAQDRDIGILNEKSGLVEQQNMVAGRDGNAEPWLREVKQAVEPITIRGEEINRFLAKQGLDTNISSEVLARNFREQGLDLDPSSKFFDKTKVGADPTDAIIFRPRSSPLADNEFAVRINGERKVFTGDPDLIATMKRLDGDRTATDWTVKVAKGFADLVRFGTVGNPITGTPFAVAHGIRAQTMAWVNSRTTNFLPFHSMLALGELMGKESETYKEWVRSGGMAGSFDTIDQKYLEKNGVYGDPKYSRYLGKTWNMIDKVWNAPHAMIQLSDNLSRFTEFKLAREQGKGPLEAATMSRDVVPDYQQVGLQRSILRTGVAFLGAHINSIDNLAYQARTNTAAVGMRLGVMSFMSAGLYLLNKDDTAVQNSPDWMKDTNWLINISRFNKDYQVGRDDQQATIVRIPKPWAAGIGIASGMEHALGAYFGERPEALHSFAHSLFESVLPEGVPTIAQPILDQFANRNAFTGRPLVPEYKQKMLPEMQYSPYTTETAKAIAKIIGYVPLVKDLGPSSDPLASPAVVENYIKTWGGSLGGYVLKMCDNAYGTATGTKVDKAEPWENTLFLSRFVAHFPNFSDQNVADFYNNKDKADKAFNTLKALNKSGDYSAAQQLMAAHPEYQVKLEGISKSISNARQAYDKIQESDMPVKEKSQQLNTILFQIGSMAKTGNLLMKQVMPQTAKR